MAARQFLVSQGIARPDAILLTGASYGGYLTLLGLGRRPELWSGGMALVAIADWVALYADEAESLRGYQRAFFGGTPEETPEQHRISSPITYAEHVQSPIIVIQGRNDTRTPARQLELYENRLRELGKDIVVHWFDAGHLGFFTDVEVAILNTERLLRFADSIVGSLPTTTP